MPSSLQAGRSAASRFSSVGEPRLTIARAATPSPRPTKPIPSPVVALTLTRPGRQAKDAGQAPADRLTVWAQLGALHHDGAVYIDKLKSLREDTREDHAQQLDRVGIAVALVAVGEVLADVPETGSTQQRVDHRVSEHVCVGVAVEAQLTGNLDAPENQRATLDQSMGVVADARESHAKRTSAAVMAPTGRQRLRSERAVPLTPHPRRLPDPRHGELPQG